MPRVAAIAIVLAALSSVVAAIPGPPAAFSANGEYSVELSSPATGQVLVAVHAHAGDAKSLAWSRRTTWRGSYDHQPQITPVAQIMARITSDGETVILRDSEAGLDRGSNEVRIFYREERKDASFRPLDMPEFSGGKLRPRETARTWHAHRSILDLLTPEEGHYALWSAYSDKWFSISLSDLSSGIVRDERQIKRLNELVHARAEELIHKHQPPPLRKAVAAVQERLAKIAPAIVPLKAPRQDSLVNASPGYFFVTARKHPSDRKYIDRLLEFPRARQIFGQIRGGAGGLLQLSVTVHPRELLLGDYLARVWDGDTNEFWPLPLAVQIPDDPLRSLSILRFAIQLPFVPPQNSEALWLYLIPSELGPNEWMSHEQTWSGRFSFERRIRATARTDEVKTVIKGLRPGEYRMKVIWKRHLSPMLLGPYVAKAGDYQSVEAGPFLIQAGQTLELPGIACTNRIGNDPAAYAEDEVWAAKWKGQE